MNKKKFSDAMTNIDSSYLEKAANYQPKKRHYIRYACTAAACFCVVAVGASVWYSNWMDVPSAKVENTTLTYETNADEIKSTESKADVPEMTAPTENDSSAANTQPTSQVQEIIIASEVDVTEKNEPPKYSELVDHDNKFAIDGGSAMSWANADIEAFSEDFVTDNNSGVVQGKVTDIHMNEYHYQTASDKFEPNGVLNHVKQTLVYTIEVEKVWNGDFQVGDTITVEDEIYWIEGGYADVQVGGTYVIPIYEYDTEIRDTDEIISGDTVKESGFMTVYPFIRQIEVVDEGYIVDEGWKTIITDEAVQIQMDDDYCRSLYLVPVDVFDRQMTALVANPTKK